MGLSRQDTGCKWPLQAIVWIALPYTDVIFECWRSPVTLYGAELISGGFVLWFLSDGQQQTVVSRQTVTEAAHCHI